MAKQTKQYEALQWASLFLEKNNCERQVAEILLRHHLNISRAAFYTMMREDVEEEVIHSFKRDLEKHVETAVPVQHLLGYEYFYGRKFFVNNDVLIPRPETEELVQHVIQTAEEHSNTPITIVDVGTGSGVIAITLALELPQATLLATDISEKALVVAKKNADQLQAEVQFSHGSFLKPLISTNEKVDMVVSNPPYIATSDRAALSKTVKYFDPALALFAEDDGLAAYKKILAQAEQVVHPNGILAFEIGDQQGEVVSSLIHKHFPLSDISVIQDINQKDRIVFAKL